MHSAGHKICRVLTDLKPNAGLTLLRDLLRAFTTKLTGYLQQFDVGRQSDQRQKRMNSLPASQLLGTRSVSV
jgi:hypothetical protein